MSDPERFFATDKLTADLKRVTVRGGAYTLSAQAAKFVLTMGATMVLARLLAPAEFGLIAMVTALMTFAEIFKDLGLAMATVQRSKINHAQVSTLFWINQAVGVTLAIIVAAASPLVAWFYKDPRLQWVTIALATTFLFSGLTIQHHALLRRQMRFKALAAIDIGAILVGITVAVLMALGGAGYWALVVRQIVVSATIAAGVWLTCGWRPGRAARRTGAKVMLAFGGHLTLFHMANYFARNLDKVLIGRRWGEGSLGLYSKAYQLLLLPIQQINAPISSVAIPALSRIKDDPARFRRYYCNAMNLISYLTAPLVVFMAALSDEIVPVMLGDQWLGASPIFQVLAIAAFGRPIMNANGWLFISLGRTKRMMMWGLISVPLFIISFAIGLGHGAIGVALAYAICAQVLRIPGFFFAFHGTPIAFRDLLRATYRPTILSLMMLLVLVAVRHWMLPHGAVRVLIAAGGAGLAALGLGVYLWPGARAEAQRMIETARTLRLTPKGIVNQTKDKTGDGRPEQERNEGDPS